MAGPWAPFVAKRPHKKRVVIYVPPAEVRIARRGQPHPRWTCGICKERYRYALKDEIPKEQCPEKGPHEFILCPTHPAWPICSIHVPGFSESRDAQKGGA